MYHNDTIIIIIFEKQILIMRFLENISEKELNASFRKFNREAPARYLPSVSIDTVIFSFHDSDLKVLILRFGNSGYSMLPGGYIGKKEALDDAAARILKERTGVDEIYLEQFYTSGQTGRSKDSRIRRLLKGSGVNLPADNWFERRYISVCYYALINGTKVSLVTQEINPGYSWCSINLLPDLLYDHNTIVNKAVERLQHDIDHKLAGFNLLDETFTMKDIQDLYEAVFRKEFTRTNFQRTMLGLGILDRLEKKKTGKPHKSPFLYRFKRTITNIEKE